MSDVVIAEHVVNENINNLESKDFLKNVFATCVDSLNVFVKLRDTKSSDPADYDEFLLPETTVLLHFAERRHSIISIVNNVLVSALESMECLDFLLDTVLDKDEVSQEMQDKIEQAAIDGISYMSTFIFYEFLNIGGYDEIVYWYCSKQSINIDDFIKENATLYKQYRRSLGVFNDYPELEQPFLEIVGPALSLIPEDALTVEDVTGVISGDIPFETLMEKLGISENDDEREDATPAGASNVFK